MGEERGEGGPGASDSFRGIWQNSPGIALPSLGQVRVSQNSPKLFCCLCSGACLSLSLGSWADEEI